MWILLLFRNFVHNAMSNFFVSRYVEDCPVMEVPEQEMTQQEKEAVEKIRSARTDSEIINIISDELARTLMVQIQV